MGHGRPSFRSPLSWTVLIVAGLAYLLLPLLEGLFIVRASGNVPISDTWTYVPQVVRYSLGGHLPWGSVFSGYGESRPAFIRMGLLLSGRYFSFNVQEIKLVSIAFGIIQTAVLLVVFRWALPRTRLGWVAVIAFPAALSTFCLAAWQNLLQEWNIINTASVALMIVSVVAAVWSRTGSKHPGLCLVLVALLCVIDSFIGESGLLDPVVCSVVLLLPPYSREVLRRQLAFPVVTVVYLLVYRWGVPGSSWAYSLHHPLSALRFAVTCMGNGVFGEYRGVNELGLSLGIGCVELVLTLAIAGALYHMRGLRGTPSVQVGLGLIAFGSLAAVSISLSRLSYGIETAVASRYTVITAPLAIGIYIVFVSIARQLRTHQSAARIRRAPALAIALSVATGVLLATSSIISDVDQRNIAPDREAFFANLEFAICFPTQVADSQLAELGFMSFPTPAQKVQALSEIAGLRRARLSVFSGPRCSLFSTKR